MLEKLDFADFRKNPILLVPLIAIVVMILVVYWADFSILVNEALYNESLTHVLMIPFLVTYILYQKKGEIKATLQFERIRKTSNNYYLTEIFGLIFCLVALLLYWFGSYTFYPLEYHLFSLPFLVIGILLVLFNVKTVVVLLFPIFFLLFLIPIPSEITSTLGGILGNFDTTAAFTLLSVFGLPVSLDSTYGAPTISVITPSGTPMLFAVDLPCSGIYSLIAFLTFATFLAYIFQGSVLKKAGIFVVGFVVMQLLNIVRIFSIIAIGYWFGEELAMSIVHGTAGWILIFGGILILLVFGEKVLHLNLLASSKKSLSCINCKNSLKEKEPFCSFCGNFLNNSTVSKISEKFWTKLFALCVGILLLSFLTHGSVFAYAQGLTFADPDVNENTEVFPDIPGYQFKFLYRDSDYEKITDQDSSLMYAYIPLNGSTPTVYVDVGVADSLTTLHNWEVCYVTWQTSQGRSPLVSVIDSRDVQLMENPSIVGRYFVFESPSNYTQITFYWYETALFNTGLTVEQKYVRISLIILVDDSATYLEHEEKLFNFAVPISEFWEPLKTASAFSLSIPIQQALLIMSTVFLVGSATTQYVRKITKKTSNLRLFEKFVQPKEKVLYEVIKKLNDGLGATAQEISCALEKSGASLEADELCSMLRYLQENGLLELVLLTNKGESKIIWKP